eukprot:227921-Ditylum_brightwellii.AAC.1
MDPGKILKKIVQNCLLDISTSDSEGLMGINITVIQNSELKVTTQINCMPAFRTFEKQRSLNGGALQDLKILALSQSGLLYWLQHHLAQTHPQPTKPHNPNSLQL